MTHVLIATDGSEQSLKAARYLRSLLDPASLERVSIIAVVRPLAAVPFASDFGEEEHAARRADDDPTNYSFRLAAQEAVERVAEELRDAAPPGGDDGPRAARRPTRSSGPRTSSRPT